MELKSQSDNTNELANFDFSTRTQNNKPKKVPLGITLLKNLPNGTKILQNLPNGNRYCRSTKWSENIGEGKGGCCTLTTSAKSVNAYYT